MPEPYDSLILVTPFPDGETVNSLLSRLADFRNDCSLTAMSRQLLARGEGLDDMPSRLDNFYTRIGHLFGDRKLLEARHTLLQYWLLGLPPEKHATQRARLWSQCSGPIRLARLPVMLAPSEGRHLVCPECAEEALDQYGFAFVHRRNVAPFVRTLPAPFLRDAVYSQTGLVVRHTLPVTEFAASVSRHCRIRHPVNIVRRGFEFHLPLQQSGHHRHPASISMAKRKQPRPGYGICRDVHVVFS